MSDRQRPGVGGAGGRLTFRAAVAADAPAVARLVDAAYGHYVERLGMRPGPMTLDYDEVVRDHEVTVVEAGGEVVGLLVLDVRADGVTVENVAVHPGHRGTGTGRQLLDRAEDEARRRGFGSVELYTHEGMTENLAIYAARGYVETERRPMGTFSLVFMSKPLA